MKKNEVKLGGHYIAKVSNKLTVIKIQRETGASGYVAENVVTGRTIHLRSARRLRKEASPTQIEKANKLRRG